MSLIGRLMHIGFILQRPMTLGVRVAAFDPEGRVFLVRHGYVRGWYLPGGGVDAGETVEEAARRELAEEGNLASLAPLRLVSVHFNRAASRRDHVVLFALPDCRQTHERAPDREIAEGRFFDRAALPEGVTGATRRRLAEILDGAASDPHW